MTRLVAGVDLGTQSTKVVMCHSSTAGRLLEDVAAIGVAGQQHGMVTLDDSGRVVRPALLWNDLRSAGSAADLVRELGGADPWARAVVRESFRALSNALHPGPGEPTC